MQSQVILTLALVLLTSCVWVFSLLQHVEHAVILSKADGRIAALEKSNRDLAGLKSELAKIKERPHPAEVEPVSVQHGVELSRRFSGPSPPITGPVSIGNRTDISTASIYDGVGVDPAHLGGSTQNDTNGQSPALWNHLLKVVNVRSFIDVGCGRGISTKWMLDHGADVLCVEGGSDAVKHSVLPKDKIVQHDFTRGAWWPEDTYDLAWGVEVLEHISRQYHPQLFPVFHKAALIFVTHSTWGGHHHTEVSYLLRRVCCPSRLCSRSGPHGGGKHGLLPEALSSVTT